MTTQPEIPITPAPARRSMATGFCVSVGLVLGIVAAFGGFVELLIVVLFGIVGLLVGRVLEGKLDVADLLGRSKGQ